MNFIEEAEQQHDEFGESILQELKDANRFSQWMFETIQPYLGERVLEVGSGIGNISRQLPIREKLTLTDFAPQYRDILDASYSDNEKVDIRKLDLTCDADFDQLKGQYDSVICLNVLEHIEDDTAALRRMSDLLTPGGQLVILVPQYKRLMSEMDRMLGHFRRYSRKELQSKLSGAGLEPVATTNFNFLGCFGWYIHNTLGGNTNFGPKKIALFERLVPLMKPIERMLPLPGLSVIGVGRAPTS